MEGTATTPAKQITVSVVRSLIKSFVANVTPEQWTFLRSAERDEDTCAILVELLLDFLSYISKDLVKSLQSSQLQSDEYVLGSDLRNSISQTFSEVINTECVSSELATLIVKEITETINSAMANHPLAETLLLLHSTSEAGDSETQLRTLIIMLVQRTYKKAKVPHRMGKPEDIVDHLLEKTRARLEDINFAMSKKQIKQLSKAIFKQLHKKTGCPSRLLLLMHLRDPQIEESLVSLLKHLTHPPEQQSTWSSFFSMLLLQHR
ncbi:hypothetical protein EXN66_Car000234 [Channa argus]|uniref:Uncharacterized protein n=1 Tax=Channa argus TaxID=215402 RepID=A0A6G1QWR1_CHAAH|nr:hypothetical protein EXN66_Car000234 [Channa argus]KAK2920720.1 hypothetical protein Q8A73_000205 [Channa argus]